MRNTRANNSTWRDNAKNKYTRILSHIFQIVSRGNYLLIMIRTMYYDKNKLVEMLLLKTRISLFARESII